MTSLPKSLVFEPEQHKGEIMNTTIENSVDLQKLDLQEFALFPERSPSSDPNYRSFLSIANEYLSGRSDYVALAPYGSQLKGVVTSESDFDVLLIAGDAKVSTDEEINKELDELALKHFGKKANSPLILSYDFFTCNFKQEKTSYAEYSHAAWMLAYPFIGNLSKIAELRDMVKKRHLGRRSVHKKHAQENLESAIHMIIFWELGIDYRGNPINFRAVREISQKLIDRGPKIDMYELLAMRKEFWRKRMEVLFGN